MGSLCRLPLTNLMASFELKMLRNPGHHMTVHCGRCCHWISWPATCNLEAYPPEGKVINAGKRMAALDLPCAAVLPSPSVTPCPAPTGPIYSIGKYCQPARAKLRLLLQPPQGKCNNIEDSIDPIIGKVRRTETLARATWASTSSFLLAYRLVQQSIRSYRDASFASI